MPNRLIFVSCGQQTDREKSLGNRIKDEIDAQDGFTPYWADSVQSLETLGANVFDALRRCAGVIAVLHQRGTIRKANGEELFTSSMWINQELSVLAYRQFFERSEIPILMFKEESVVLEGAMTAFIVNPKPLTSEDHVISSEVHQWLSTDALKGRVDEQEVFQEKWDSLTLDNRAVVSALIREGGHHISLQSIKTSLIQNRRFERNHAATAVRDSSLRLKNLVILQDTSDGRMMSLHPDWEWYIRHAAKSEDTKRDENDR